MTDRLTLAFSERVSQLRKVGLGWPIATGPSPSPSPTHSHSLSLALTLSHSHPHSRSLTLTFTHSPSPSPSPPWIFLFSPVPGLKCRYGSALFPSNETCCLTPEVACQKRLPPGNNLTHCCQRNSQSTPRELSGARPLSIAIPISV
jgi:hypothetical protein